MARNAQHGDRHADHAHHDHAEHEGEPLADAAAHAMRSAGEQWTETRAAVFDALAAFDRPASAYDIAERVSAARGRRVAPNSVYRILDLFVANNVAMRVESANAYVANSHPGCVHDCIFLVCDRCRQVLHVDNDGVTGQVRAMADGTGFATSRPVIELRGVCADCA